MAKRDAHPSEQLQQLINERQRYEAWLASLHARRDAAPAHVVSRVEEDYRRRLSKISEDLAARAGELRARADALSTRLGEIRLQESARRDEKAEAEIRTAVGEYSPGQWSEISERVDSELSTFEADRQVVERELAELQSVLQHVTGEAPPAAGAVVQADATRTAAAPVQSAAAAPAPPSGPRPAPRPAPVPHKIAAAVASDAAVGSDAAAAPRPTSNAPNAPAARAPSADAASPSVAAANPATGGTSLRGRAPAPGTQRRTDASQREGQEKTLLCSECGTANYPTEWYCEACGAELSTL